MSDAVPDYFGALTGWRRFNLVSQRRILASANLPTPWLTPDGGDAVCLSTTGASEHDETPDLHCSCGFYSYKTKADALQHAQGTVLAQVEIWGRIVEHARGYRSARMKIMAISVPHGFDQIAALEKRYACPVTQEDLWISENPNASSSSNPYQSPFVSPSWTYPPFISPNLPASPNVSSQSQWNAQYAQAMQQYQQQLATMQAQMNVGSTIHVRMPPRYAALLGSGVVSGFVSVVAQMNPIAGPALVAAAAIDRTREFANIIAESARHILNNESNEDDSKVRYAEWKAAWTDPKQPTAK